ncbi:unnamed protein product [Tuber melanosporum]|uniref:(Perigord truffle) hypothetical protein n=1 Tax=Tuber melanosporum (strain Mel28) TaxID=656061 RepID=D5G7P6_TUBMM|nr:uncharacterized protein GSTUM_00004670001 [Tuber melanosporum]CAZ80539.1 unnamed protein product [Tuber melanosporum]
MSAPDALDVEDIESGLRLVHSLPEQVHWLCDKIEKRDDGVEVKYEGDKSRRNRSVTHAMVLLSFADQEATQAWFTAALNAQLSRCPRCVEQFYILKKGLYRELLEADNKDNVDMFFNFLHTCDANRVGPVLKEVASELRNSPTVESWHQTFQSRAQYRNGVYEVFCCPDLLRDPEINADFTDICATRKVFPEGPGEGLISFLFRDDERLRFPVEHSWKELGPHITPEVFETHLLATLEAQVQRMEVQSDPGQLQLFFAGLVIIVQSVSKELIMKCICGAQNDPIKLAVNRISNNASYLPALLGLFDALMIQLGFEFWDVAQPLTPSALIDTLLANGIFANLLKRAPQDTSGERLLIGLTGWMSSLVASVRPLSRATPAAPLLRLLLKDRSLPALSKGICLKEGMKILSMTLSGVSAHPIEGEGGRMILRQTNELFDEYTLLVVEIAISFSTRFNDQIMANHMGIAQKNAYNAMLLALELDVKVMKTDFSLLSKKKPEIPHAETSIRTSLWDAVCKNIPINHVKLATDLLLIFCEIFGIGKSVHPKGIDTGSEADRRRDAFNKALDILSRCFARIFQRISQFAPDKLKMVVNGEHSRIALFVGVIFPPKDVAFGAEDILLSCYGVDSRENAIHAMFDENLAMALSAVTAISRTQAKSSVFDLMPAMIRFNQEILEVLCAPDKGVISNIDLENWTKTALRVYWDIQWRVVDYATELFRRFWTFEQAFRAKGPDNESTRPQREASWRARLLQDPSKALDSIAALLTIQDMHLLSSSQELMCNILELLAKENVDVEDEFVNNMRPILFSDSRAGARTMTNLVEAQKAQLMHALSAVRPDFAPLEAKSKIVEISDDEYDDIPDDDLIRASERSLRIASRKQARLDFPVAPTPPTYEQKLHKVGVSKSSSIIDDLRVGTPKAISVVPRNEFLLKRKADLAASEAAKAARLELKKKEQAPVVPSSDEDDSSDDGGGNGLFRLGNSVQRSTKPIPEPKLIDAKPKNLLRQPAVPTRRVKDNRARVAPDLSPLYKQVLKWEFFHDDVFPPGLSATNYSKVASTFGSYAAYKKTFEPLLLLEAWQALKQAKEEAPQPVVKLNLVTRMSADNFVELEITIDGMNERNRWLESDVVLVSVGKKPLASKDSPHCLARVHSLKKKFPGANTTEVQLRCDPSPQMVQENMRNGSTLYATRIMGFVPTEREYSALMCLKYYDLEQEILAAKPSSLEEPTEKQIVRTRGLYKVNEPQARAILSAVKNTGFTLIQGPPGTGKTKTVVGIVGALLTPKVGSTVIQIPGSMNKSPKPTTKKLLVCAPSNAAVDELVLRFKKGILTAKGEEMQPKVVRIGKSDAVNFTVRDVTLDELVERKMAPTKESANSKNADMDELRQKHRAILDERDAKLKQLEDARAKSIDPGTLQSEIDSLNATLRETRRSLDLKRDQKKESSRNAEVLKRRIQQEIMDEAHIICATLSGTGHDLLRNINVDFETVIIDEAAQSVELSALIPLKFGCEKCILVGDPKQLPPTVLSREAAKFSYEKSLFVRMQENHPKDVHLLSIQYRMHPMISSFPRKQFYDSELEDGENMKELRTEVWHKNPIYAPYRFFNIAGQESAGGLHSLVNRQEAQSALSLYQRLTADFPQTNFDGKIGIITPYKQQINLLKTTFRDVYGENICDTIDFNTTDAFQGRERDIIIFSCVRASQEGGIGFLSDVRRMNVGLTRAKFSLFVLGHSTSLMRNRLWASLVQDAKDRGVFDEETFAEFGSNAKGNRAGGTGAFRGSTRGRGGQARNSTRNTPPPVAPKVDPDAMDIDEPEPQAPHQPNPSHIRLCFECNQPGHIANSCPNRQGPRNHPSRNSNGPGPRPMPPAGRGNDHTQNQHHERLPQEHNQLPNQPTRAPKRPIDGEGEVPSKRQHLENRPSSANQVTPGPSTVPVTIRPPHKKKAQRRSEPPAVFINPKRGGGRGGRGGGGRGGGQPSRPKG